jgi:uncharacterized protein HemX
MKKVFEGASIVSAILLILTAACAFIFNVKNQSDKSKERKRAERHIEKSEKKKDSHYSQQLRDLEKEKEKSDEELDHYKKLNDPFWHYYDPEKGEFNTLPGKYGVDDPPPRPRGY